MRREDMKTPLLVSIVVGIHCVAVGCVVMMPGCGTARGPIDENMDREEIIMPRAMLDQPSETGLKSALQPPVKDIRSWPDQTTTYVVRKGDSISDIAHRYGLSVREIAAMNSIKDSNMIRSGQKLILPGTIDVTGKPRRVASDTVSKTGSGNIYVVKPGDCLSVIAKSLGVTMAGLREANGFSGDMVRVGQKLRIPGEGGVNTGGDVMRRPESVGLATSQLSERGSVENDLISMTVHVVEDGETIQEVAIRWGVSVSSVKEFNELGDDEELVPGQVLKIPRSQ